MRSKQTGHGYLGKRYENKCQVCKGTFTTYQRKARWKLTYKDGRIEFACSVKKLREIADREEAI